MAAALRSALCSCFLLCGESAPGLAGDSCGLRPPPGRETVLPRGARGEAAAGIARSGRLPSPGPRCLESSGTGGSAGGAEASAGSQSCCRRALPPLKGCICAGKLKLSFGRSASPDGETRVWKRNRAPARHNERGTGTAVPARPAPAGLLRQPTLSGAGHTSPDRPCLRLRCAMSSVQTSHLQSANPQKYILINLGPQCRVKN